MTNSSFFASVLCCCGQRSTSPDVLDETSRLLPAVEDLPSPDASNIVVVDQQRLRDRWTSIVRAKEGKMVNVNAALPFNLHNQALPHHSHTHSASASRSRSLSADRHRHPSSTSSRDPYATISRANGMLLAPSSSSRSTDLRAAAGFDMGVGEGGVEGRGGGVMEEGTGMESRVRSPLLGLRLVNLDGVAVGPSSSASMREGGRGRPGWSGPAVDPSGSSHSRGRTAGGGDDEMTPRPPGIVTRPQEIKLNIGDAGAITVSWGD